MNSHKEEACKYLLSRLHLSHFLNRKEKHYAIWPEANAPCEKGPRQISPSTNVPFIHSFISTLDQIKGRRSPLQTLLQTKLFPTGFIKLTMAYAPGSFSSSLRHARANRVLSSLSGLWPDDQQLKRILAVSEMTVDNTLCDGDPKFQDLMTLVDCERDSGSLGGHDNIDRQSLEGFQNSPIFTSGVDRAIHSKLLPNTDEVIPQYGLIGMQLETPGLPPKDKLVLANMNIPWSAFICGSQGAGKSHTLSCLLESYIDSTCGAGKLPRPLAALVMHYDNFTNDTTTQLCEAAYLCSSGIPVNVLVCPSNIWTMKRLYKSLPGLPPGANRPNVMPLYLTTKQLNISRILKLMAVDPSSDNTPLYMEVVINIVRQMAMEGPGFAYHEFRRRLTEVKWAAGQEVPLKLRLQLLDTFLAPSTLTETSRPAQAEEDIWAFAPGSLTIVDLSDPFMASEDACALFSICLSIFMEDRGTCGRVVAVDEAHKVMNTGWDMLFSRSSAFHPSC